MQRSPNQPAFRFSIGRKILLIAGSFALPIAVLAYFVAATITSNIEFSRQETYGNDYQRPLAQVLETVFQHREAVRDGATSAQLHELTAKVDAAFDALATADGEVGAALQFTEEGLGIRDRAHVRVPLVRAKWTTLAEAAGHGWRAELSEGYSSLVGDVRTMIAHAGDTSNLILDPDLDSYYLMDCTLLALPQTQDRIGQILAFVHDCAESGEWTDAMRVQFAVHAAQLSESDIDRVVASTETALNEDAQFYGVHEGVQSSVRPALEAYVAASKEFLSSIQSAASSAEPVEFDLLVAQGREALDQSFRYWEVAIDALDDLLDVRLASLASDRTWSLAMSGLAVVVASLIAFATARAITRPLSRCSNVLQGMARGRFDADIDVKSGDEVGDMARALASTRDVLQDLMSETRGLMSHVREGRLDRRASADRFAGMYGDLCQGINEMLEGLVVPIRDCSGALERVAAGDLALELQAEYPGDWEAVERSLRGTVDVLRGLLEETHTLTRAAESGTLSVRANVARFGGGYRELCEGINSMLDAMLNPVRATLGVLDKVANRDLTVGVSGDFKGEHARLKSAVNGAVAEMRAALGAIVSSSDVLSGTTRELASVSKRMSANANATSADAQAVSSAAEQVSTSIGSIASATEEMGASIREIARNATSVSTVMGEAVTKAGGVQEAMDKLVDSSREIGNVIKLITSVAAQTNLLALNATIEAARAGEAGKGFAVVASEVKQLSDQTSQAASQIAEQIRTIQADADNARGALGEIISVVQEVNSASLAIAAAVEQQTQTTNEISGNVNEVARGSGDIAGSITRVATAAGETSADVRRAEVAAEDLARAAARLAEIVAQFECGETALAASK